VDAKKGMKIEKLPDHLMIVLNRFTLDFNTFQRVKINEHVSFPRILNMNDYTGGYENIKNKLYDQEVERQGQYRQKEVEERRLKELNKRQKLDERNKPKEAEVA
jgi:ubiquitin C-terminal hydrolase